MLMKKWKCTVCGYIHTGETPPDECPVCHQGAEVFVLLEEGNTVDGLDKKKVQESLFSISYGLYVVGSKSEEKLNAQCCNTLMQVTSEPLQIIVGINKGNLTHEYIKKSGIVTVGVIGEDGHNLVKHFGYQTGHKTDKFANIKYTTGMTGGPFVDGCIAYFEGNVIEEQTMDAGTHSVFLVQLSAGKKGNSSAEPMTYAHYRKTR